MKKQLLILSSACLLLTACEIDRTRTPVTMQEKVGSEADRKTTEKVRQSLMEDTTLSPNAKDIKIVTLDGIVTLRGSVKNEEEKGKIERKAKGVGGVKGVDNQLDLMIIEVPKGQ